MIKPFPTSAQEFYALRDDRTNQCTAKREYQDIGCLVTTNPEFLSTPSGRILFEAGCNLLARWCRYVEIVTSKQHSKCCDTVIAGMCDADPFGTFKSVVRPTGRCKLQLHIGSSPTWLGKQLVTANSNGWHGTIATNTDLLVPTHRGDRNVIGAIAAACLSGTQLFKLAIDENQTRLLRDGTFDMRVLQWTQSETSAPPPTNTKHIGRVLLVGAGSVGSAAVHWMKTIGLNVDLQIIEGDTVKVENFNRSPLFGKSSYSINKALAVARAMRGSSVQVTDVTQLWWDDAIQLNGRPAADIWLPLANDFNVRWSIQNNIPPLMIHGSTGRNWLANFGRHIPICDDCLQDRFSNTVDVAALTCSEGPIMQATKTIDAALPFLSFFAGLLVATDLARLTISDYPLTHNYAAIDFGGSMDLIQSWDRKPRPNCICTKQSISMHERVNGSTRYASFFRREVDTRETL